MEFEEALLNDGCAGIAVINPQKRMEVQLDEHKLLIVYGPKKTDLAPFARILERSGIEHVPDIKFITEAEHVHSSSEKYYEQFQALAQRLGMDDGDCYRSEDEPFGPEPSY